MKIIIRNSSLSFQSKVKTEIFVGPNAPLSEIEEYPSSSDRLRANDLEYDTITGIKFYAYNAVNNIVIYKLNIKTGTTTDILTNISSIIGENIVKFDTPVLLTEDERISIMSPTENTFKANSTGGIGMYEGTERYPTFEIGYGLFVLV